MEPYPPSNPVLLIAAAALINADGQVLVQLRPPGKPMAGLWEFPGGKVEPGETPSGALVRELREELAIGVDERDVQPFTFASERLGERHLILLLYVCRKWEGDAQPLIASRLKWCDPEELQTLDMPPADIPLVAELRRIL